MGSSNWVLGNLQSGVPSHTWHLFKLHTSAVQNGFKVCSLFFHQTPKYLLQTPVFQLQWTNAHKQLNLGLPWVLDSLNFPENVRKADTTLLHLVERRRWRAPRRTRLCLFLPPQPFRPLWLPEWVTDSTPADESAKWVVGEINQHRAALPLVRWVCVCQTHGGEL